MLSKESSGALLKESILATFAKIALTDKAETNNGDTTAVVEKQKQSDIIHALKLGYSQEELRSVPQDTTLAMGCGNPTAFAELKPGETVLDVGSGGGFDCFLAAQKVGSTGKVIGVDMMPEMIDKARLSATQGNFYNVEFRLGQIETLPVSDASIDVIISNCCVNLSTDKSRVIKEAARVLKPGGRVVLSENIAITPLPEPIQKNPSLYRCMTEAMTSEALSQKLHDAGLQNVTIEVKESSRDVIKEWALNTGAENYILSAMIRAVKPLLELKALLQQANIAIAPLLGKGLFTNSKKQVSEVSTRISTTLSTVSLTQSDNSS